MITRRSFVPCGGNKIMPLCVCGCQRPQKMAAESPETNESGHKAKSGVCKSRSPLLIATLWSLSAAPASTINPCQTRLLVLRRPNLLKRSKLWLLCAHRSVLLVRACTTQLFDWGFHCLSGEKHFWEQFVQEFCILSIWISCLRFAVSPVAKQLFSMGLFKTLLQLLHNNYNRKILNAY